MVKLGLANSRMKDFYDLFVLARDFQFHGDVLRQAIHSTFARRDTEIPADIPVAWTDIFAEDRMKATQWKAFLRKSSLDAPSLSEVVATVRAFLDPIRRAIRDELSMEERWIDGNWRMPVTGESE